MLKQLLVHVLLLVLSESLVAQYLYCEADWFDFRLQWAGHFESIKPIDDQKAIVWHDGRCGIADRQGKLLLPLQYRESYYPTMLRDGQRLAGIRNDGSIWTLDGYDHVQPFPNNTWLVTNNNLKGLLDSALQRRILPLQFVEIIASIGNRLYTIDTNGTRAEFDYSGRQHPPLLVSRLSNGLFVRQDAKMRYALADSTGALLSEYKFNYIIPLCDGTFWGRLYGNKPIIGRQHWQIFQHYDAQGKRLPDPDCQSMFSAGAGILKVLQEGRYKLWDHCGQELLPGASWNFEENQPVNFYKPNPEPFLPADIVRFQKGNLFGAFLNAGKKTIALQYSRIYAAPGKLIACRAEGGTDWYDLAGNLLRTTSDSLVGRADYSQDRFFIASKDGLRGVIDAEGKVLIAPKYAGLQMDKSGIYICQDKTGKRLLDPQGVEIPLPAGCSFDQVCGNYILFRREMRGGLTDLRGRVVLPPRYDWLSPMHDNYFFYFKGENGLYGLVTPLGDTILPPDFRQGAIIQVQGYFLLEKNSLYGITDRKGRLVQPFEYTGKQQIGQYILLQKGRETFVFHLADGTTKPAGFEWSGLALNPYVSARKNGAWGLLQSDLTPVLPFEFDTIFPKENHLVARHGKRDQWYKEEDGVLAPLHVDRVLEAHYWATRFERNGKQGLTYAFGDSLPAIYDRILLDYISYRVLATLKDGICQLPDEGGASSRFSFPADSLRGFYIPSLLQYWYRGEAWLMNTENGAKRRMELLVKPGEEYKYQIYADIQEPGTPAQVNMYRVRIDGRERYALLDSMLQDLVPDSLDIDPSKYIHRPDGKLMLRIVRQRREGLWDVTDRKWVFPCAYTAVEKVEQQTAQYRPYTSVGRVVSYPAPVVLLKKDDRYGLGRISDGVILLPVRYEYIAPYITKDSLLSISKNGKYGFYRLSDGKMLPPLYADPRPDARGLIYLRGDGGSGLANTNLDIIIPAEYERVEQTGAYFMVQKNELLGFYDRQGNLVQPCQYTRIERMEGSGKLVVEKQGKQALFDEDLQALSGFDFDYIDPKLLPGGRLIFSLERWDSVRNCMVMWRGLMDTSGKVLQEARFRLLYFCRDRFVAVGSASLDFGILATDMSTLVPFRYDHIRCTGDSNFIVQKNNLWGLMNWSGQLLVKPEYEDLMSGYGESTPYWAKQKGRYAMMDQTGRLLTGFVYDKVRSFDREGRAEVERGGRSYVIDAGGKCVKDCE